MRASPIPRLRRRFGEHRSCAFAWRLWQARQPSCPSRVNRVDLDRGSACPQRRCSLMSPLLSSTLTSPRFYLRAAYRELKNAREHMSLHRWFGMVTAVLLLSTAAQAADYRLTIAFDKTNPATP